MYEETCIRLIPLSTSSGMKISCHETFQDLEISKWLNKYSFPNITENI